MLEIPFLKRDPFAPRIEEALFSRKIRDKLGIFPLDHNIRLRFDTLLAISRLVVELEEQMIKYDCIISDEVGARTIALILRNVINHQRRKNQLQPILSYFIKGGRYLNKVTYQAIQNYLINKRPQFGNKALLVTEYIDTGGSIAKLGSLLDSADINYDIAAVSLSQEFIEKPPKIRGSIYYGEVNNTGLELYLKSPYHGVTKKNSYTNPHPTKDPFNYIGSVKKWRREIKNLSQALINLVE